VDIFAVMSKPPPSLIDCPHCGAKYKVVRVEAPAAFDKYVTCLGCGGALETREGQVHASDALNTVDSPSPWFRGSFVFPERKAQITSERFMQRALVHRRNDGVA